MLQGWLDEYAGVTGVGMACIRYDGCSDVYSTNAELGDTLPRMVVQMVVKMNGVWVVGKYFISKLTFPAHYQHKIGVKTVTKIRPNNT